MNNAPKTIILSYLSGCWTVINDVFEFTIKLTPVRLLTKVSISFTDTVFAWFDDNVTLVIELIYKESALAV
jgi:hypothetical protein